MSFVKDFKESIFNINDETFEDSSLAVFNYQYHNCEIYKTYCQYLKKSPKNVHKLPEIPFLPIEFFKNHVVKSDSWKSEKVFKSSGTTGSVRSLHHVKDVNYYHEIAKKIFEERFGSLKEMEVIALLPSYLEQGDSSLISMVDFFIEHANPNSGYYLQHDLEEVLKSKTRKIVIGVSYALLDLAETEVEVANTTIIETGGMKGRKKEMTRTELHGHLKNGFRIDEIWSEYGMTELLSQAYGKNGLFSFPSWAKCLIRDVNDPFTLLEDQKSGGINIMDLGNIDSCSFIETKDLGRVKNGTFEVLGRFDNSDVRGCNLLI